jgi:hypothetical protein
VRAADGEILTSRIPHITRRDLSEAYVTLHDMNAPAAAQSRRGLYGRFRSRLTDWFRPDGTVVAPFSVVKTRMGCTQSVG